LQAVVGRTIFELRAGTEYSWYFPLLLLLYFLLLLQAVVGKTIAELMAGTEQLVFSFLVPSTLSHSNNIAEMQSLVSEGQTINIL
jgi:hypothetical protein